ncbi:MULTISPECIES: patatin-like phospholipase family protein [unclassified Bradyrhizobium]|uniref:patatin-like phospholipase family protein n=1 Tax=unclassified Bradyrhizobium TaxID=2631580 RepID=UPI0028EC00D5|nr:MULTISPECIES: patatin-like phospholipase family protein [unclassified Bradyrhizobium]
MGKTGRPPAPHDINYLSFQGGGGLGFAYLGAVSALEDPKIGLLPIRPASGGPIRGISGASAGAITATLLALGCSSKDLKQIFSQRERFLAFYDGPDVGLCRAIDAQHLEGTRLSLLQKTDMGTTTVELAKYVSEVIGGWRDLQDEAVKIAIANARNSGELNVALILAMLVGASRTSIEKKIDDIKKDYPFTQKVFKKPKEYLLNLTNDRGIFPGFAIRDFLRETIRQRVLKIGVPARLVKGDAANIDFRTFLALTGVDLRISGTNISQRRTQIFSAASTPDFLVAEAVGISACYPLVFKPVYVKADPRDKTLGPLRGLWVDGGVLNNFPVHAFDVQKSRADLPKLNTAVLGFMLQDGSPDMAEPFLDPERDETPLPNFAGGLLRTLLTPGNEGQLRTAQEASQTVPLFTYDLSLFEFAPEANVYSKPVQEARNAVLRHFGM